MIGPFTIGLPRHSTSVVLYGDAEVIAAAAELGATVWLTKTATAESPSSPPSIGGEVARPQGETERRSTATDAPPPWHWYAGRDEEVYQIGPCDTREQALAEAIADELGIFDDADGQTKLSIHLVEARKDPLRLATWIDIERMLEHAEEAIIESDLGCEHDNGPFFDAAPEQEADLKARIARACDEWQAAHAIRPTTWTFTHMRNHEHVVVPAVDQSLEQPA